MFIKPNFRTIYRSSSKQNNIEFLLSDAQDHSRLHLPNSAVAHELDETPSTQSSNLNPLPESKTGNPPAIGFFSRFWENISQFNRIFFFSLFFQTGIDSKLRTTYLILLGLLIGCLLISFSIHSNPNWLKDFSLDLASEIIGILLVVFSVDRVIDAERDQKRKKKEKVALQQLKTSIIRHLTLLKFANNSAIFPEKLIEIKSESSEHGLAEENMNFSFFNLDSPMVFSQSDPISEFDFLASECCEFRKSANRILEKYSFFLQPELINSLEKSINSPFILSAVNSLKIHRTGGEKTDLNHFPDFFKDHVNKVGALIEVYNKNISSDREIKI